MRMNSHCSRSRRPWTWAGLVEAPRTTSAAGAAAALGTRNCSAVTVIWNPSFAALPEHGFTTARFGGCVRDRVHGEKRSRRVTSMPEGKTSTPVVIGTIKRQVVSGHTQGIRGKGSQCKTPGCSNGFRWTPTGQEAGSGISGLRVTEGQGFAPPPIGHGPTDGVCTPPLNPLCHGLIRSQYTISLHP